MKKVILDLEDFDKIAKYITTQSIPFLNAAKASEIAEILKKVVIAEVEEKTKENDTKT
jgi:hypothetical protein